MGPAPLTLVLLLVGCFSLGTWVGPHFERPAAEGEQGLLAGIMGESRKLFANHFFVRSDIYFHSGYYPTIFDQGGAEAENHLATGAGAKEARAAVTGHVHDEHCEHGEEHNFLGKPKDFMDGFSRHFFVSQHTHLTEKGTNAAREILPWLILAARLDPKKTETYTVGAYWLRDLKKNAEAEEFLRDGLRHNAQSYELLFELGRCHFDRSDFVGARNLWEIALQRWREQENPKPVDQQDRFLVQQILNHLARVDARLGDREHAVQWLQIVRKLSPRPAEIDKRIQEVREGKLLDEALTSR